MPLSLFVLPLSLKVMLMIAIQRAIVISVGIFLAASTAGAGWFGADFSADTYQVSPQGQVVQGRMFVGKGKVRTEMTVRGNTVIEIIDPEKGLAWVLEPSTNSYRERLVPKRAMAGPDDSPCDGLVSANCDFLGKELLNGRASRKWRININGQQQIQWRDNEHRFPVKVVEGGQSVMEMQFMGLATVNSRQVENWLVTQYTPQGALRSRQWYDPQLNVAIRQQMEDGAMRELRNIRLEKPSQSLFELPDNYRPSEVK